MSNLSKGRLLAVGCLALLCATAVEAVAGDESGNPKAASAELHDAQGNSLGTVRFLPRGDGKVVVRAEAGLIPQGFHGFHVHSIGICEAPFTSAGGHFNSGGATHGSHAGDMPSLRVDGDGNAYLEFETDAFTVDDLLDEDGSAVIVHAGPDNFANIPARYTSGGVPGP